MPTIAHISDLHLQSGVPTRQMQIEPILRKINEMKPDLVVISGDVTDDGWDSIEELKWAKRWLDERIDGDWFAVPGNHDVGNFVDLKEGQINDERVAHWDTVFGTRPVVELDGWQVIGLNSMRFGGNQLQCSNEEIDWLTTNTDRLKEKPLVIFLHSPLFIDSIDEQENPAANYWLGSEQDRKTTWDLLRSCGVRLIGSGHVHQTRLADIDGITMAWAPPASGTWVHAPGLPNPEPPKRTGFWIHRLNSDGHIKSEVLETTTMITKVFYKPWP
ncbi:MAG: metallophosphoesterase [Planctomycetota bacterium]